MTSTPELWRVRWDLFLKSIPYDRRTWCCHATGHVSRSGTGDRWPVSPSRRGTGFAISRTSFASSRESSTLPFAMKCVALVDEKRTISTHSIWVHSSLIFMTAVAYHPVKARSNTELVEHSCAKGRSLKFLGGWGSFDYGGFPLILAVFHWFWAWFRYISKLLSQRRIHLGGGFNTETPLTYTLLACL